MYLLEGFYVLPTRESAKSHEILRKSNQNGNNPVGKKVNNPKGKYIFIMKSYSEGTRKNLKKCLKIPGSFLLLALDFYQNPRRDAEQAQVASS